MNQNRKMIKRIRKKKKIRRKSMIRRALEALIRLIRR